MDEQIKVEKRREYDRLWKKEARKKNPDKVRAAGRLKYQKTKADPEKWKKHQEYMREYQKKWSKDNPKWLAYRREWMKNWYRRNAKEIYARRMKKPHEKIVASMRSRIYRLLKHGEATRKTEKMLGITAKELKIYMEKLFKEGMTWENYGFHGWQTDHLVPLSSYDLTKPEEQQKAFHYTNLQPLWAEENRRKYTKIS